MVPTSDFVNLNSEVSANILLLILHYYNGCHHRHLQRKFSVDGHCVKQLSVELLYYYYYVLVLLVCYYSVLKISEISECFDFSL